MREFTYTRTCNNSKQHIKLKEEVYKDIIKEHGTVKAWLETIIHEPIIVSVVEKPKLFLER